MNNGLLSEFSIGPFSVYRMSEYRGNELVSSFQEMLSNFQNLIRVFRKQDVGYPYDVIMPYGFFYRIGRYFILLGILFLLLACLRSAYKRTYSAAWLLLFWLMGAFAIGLLISVRMTQINMAYIPLLVCEAIGIVGLVRLLPALVSKMVPCAPPQTTVQESDAHVGPHSVKMDILSCVASCLIAIAFLYQTYGFASVYFGDYKALTEAYFQVGTDEAVKYIVQSAGDEETDVYIWNFLRYPNVCLAAEIDAATYLDHVVYTAEPPEPASYQKENITFHQGFDTSSLDTNAVYLLYYTQADYFKDDFVLMPFYDWYVAMPKH